MTDEPIEIAESELRELYATLADATEAHARGNPNECASKAADAKQMVLEIHLEHEDD